MAQGRPPVRDLAALVDNMFSNVLGPDERAELLVRIREWEQLNPDVSPAQRVTGWIDVAYAFQTEQRPHVTGVTETEAPRGTFVTGYSALSP